MASFSAVTISSARGSCTCRACMPGVDRRFAARLCTLRIRVPIRSCSASAVRRFGDGARSSTTQMLALDTASSVDATVSCADPGSRLGPQAPGRACQNDMIVAAVKLLPWPFGPTSDTTAWQWCGGDRPQRGGQHQGGDPLVRPGAVQVRVQHLQHHRPELLVVRRVDHPEPVRAGEHRGRRRRAAPRW